MLARAVAFLIIFLFLFAAMVASFNRKPPRGQYLIDANLRPTNASVPKDAVFTCTPTPLPEDWKVERSKKVQQV